MRWEDPRMLPYASPTYFGEILDLPAFPANWKKSRLWQQAKVNNRQVKCLGLGECSGFFSTISAPGARGTAARSQGRAPLCNTRIMGSSYLMPLAAPGDGSRGRSHWLLEPWLLEGDVRLGQQLPGASTVCPSGLTHLNTAQKAAAGHF